MTALLIRSAHFHERPVVDEQDDHISPLDCLVESGKPNVSAFRQLGRQGPHMGLNRQDLSRLESRQRGSDLDRRAFTQIVDICLECQPQTGDQRILEAGGVLSDLRDDMV